MSNFLCRKSVINYSIIYVCLTLEHQSQETLKDLHKNDWMYFYDSGGQCQCYDLFDGGGVKVREKTVDSRKVVVVGCYNKTKGFKKKIDLHLKNVQLLSTFHEFHENFILVEKSCAFKYGTFLSLICDQMSSSYFILVVLPYCQLIDRDKSVFEKSCDSVINLFKSNTVPQVSLPIIIIINCPVFVMDTMLSYL